MTSLHPMHRVGDQISETVSAHRDVSKKEAADLAVDALRRVGIPSPEERARQYPHEFSGGMRQRAMIAMGIVLEPDLLIADEPTTALDVTVQAQILELIGELKERLGIGVILISHNLGVIADVAQRVMIMYAGRPVEIGARDAIFTDPRHPYSWGLIESIPRPDVKVERLRPIEGAPPSLIHVPPGCPFHPRCPHRFAPCDTERPPLGGEAGHLDACHLPPADKVRLWAERRRRLEETAGGTQIVGAPTAETAQDDTPLVDVEGLDQGVPDHAGRDPAAPDRRREGGGAGHVLHPARGDPRPGGRVGLRQVHHRPPGDAPARPHGRHRALRRPRHHDPGRRGAAVAAAPDADDLPGPLRLAEPAPPGGDDHRGALPDPRLRRRPPGRGAAADGARRAQPRALQPLPPRVLGRPASAHRRRPRAGAEPPVDRRRRAGVRPRRLHPGADPQPADGPPAASATSPTCSSRTTSAWCATSPTGSP